MSAQWQPWWWWWLTGPPIPPLQSPSAVHISGEVQVYDEPALPFKGDLNVSRTGFCHLANLSHLSSGALAQAAG